LSATLVAFPAAPLDGTARIVTRALWGLALVLALAGAWLLATGEVVTGAVLVGSGALEAALVWYLGRLRPVEYLLDDGGLAIRRRKVPTKRYDGIPRNARRGRLGIRVAGDGGGYGYLGRYRAEGKTVHAFVTNRDDVVLLDVGEAALAISPGDPDAFLAEVAGAA
jgi:hypothetical protein